MNRLTLSAASFKVPDFKYGLILLFKLLTKSKTDGKGKAATGLYKKRQ